MARHPRGIAERRIARRRTVARRVRLARALWYSFSELDAARSSRWAKWNPLVCCAFCQYDDPRPARWRWDRVLDADGDLPRPPLG